MKIGNLEIDRCEYCPVLQYDNNRCDFIGGTIENLDEIFKDCPLQKLVYIKDLFELDARQVNVDISIEDYKLKLKQIEDELKGVGYEK